MEHVAAGSTDPLLITADHVLTMDGEAVTDGAVVVDDKRITWVGPAGEAEERGPFSRRLGGRGFLLVPGFVSAHHHTESWSHRRLGWRGPLERIEPLDMYMGPWDEEDVYWMNLYTNAQLAKSGVTGVLAYFYAMRELPSLGADAVARAAIDSRLRYGLGIAARDRWDVVHARDGDEFFSRLPHQLAEEVRSSPFSYPLATDEAEEVTRQLAATYADHAERFRMFACPDWTPSSTDEQYLRMKALAKELGTGVLTHLLESSLEMAHSFRVYGKSAVERLVELEFLGPEVTCTDAVWLTARDIDLVKDSGARVVYSPFHVRGMGVAPVRQMVEAGVPTAFSILIRSLDDRYDTLCDLRVGEFLQRVSGIEAEGLTALDMLRMATLGGAQAWSLDDGAGRIAAGQVADLVLLESEGMWDDPFLADDVDPHRLLLYRGGAADVHTVLIGGEVVVDSRRYLPLDEDELNGRIRERVRGMRERGHPTMGRWEDLANRLEPHVVEFYRSWGMAEAMRERSPSAIKGFRPEE